MVLRVTDPCALEEACATVKDRLHRVDLACSRFREDSELATVNRAAGRNVQIGPLLCEALQLALRAAELTDGLVDPCMGRALLLAGYDRDWRLLERPPEGADEPDAAQQDAARQDAARQDAARQDAAQPAHPLRLRAVAREGWRAVHLDSSGASVRIPVGASLDLGATAKAWAADLCAAAAAATTGAGALVSLGGDVAVAGPAPAGGWRIHVTDDHRAEATAPGQTVSIRSGGLATSSTSVRRWVCNGRQMHHILDPRTGMPARGGWRTVSVAAASCADANIASTASILKGRAAEGWLTEMGLPARLVAEDGEVVTVGDWPAPCWEATAHRASAAHRLASTVRPAAGGGDESDRLADRARHDSSTPALRSAA